MVENNAAKWLNYRLGFFSWIWLSKVLPLLPFDEVFPNKPTLNIFQMEHLFIPDYLQDEQWDQSTKAILDQKNCSLEQKKVDEKSECEMLHHMIENAKQCTG